MTKKADTVSKQDLAVEWLEKNFPVEEGTGTGEIIEAAYRAGYDKAVERAASLIETESDCDLRCMNDCKLKLADLIRENLK